MQKLTRRKSGEPGMIHIDEELYPDEAEAMRVATYVVLSPRGLKRFPDLAAIIVEAGWETRNDWVYEALYEALRLLKDGRGWVGNSLYREVASCMTSMIRRERKGVESFEPLRQDVALMLSSAEDVYLAGEGVGDSLQLYEYLADRLTARQWDMVRTYVSTGSPSETAELCGSSKSNVLRAVRRARKILEGAPTFSQGNVQGGNGDGGGVKLGGVDTLFVLEGDGLTVTVADRRASVGRSPT